MADDSTSFPHTPSGVDAKVQDKLPQSSQEEEELLLPLCDVDTEELEAADPVHWCSVTRAHTVSSFFSYQSHHCCVISKLYDGVEVVCCHAVEGVQEWTNNRNRTYYT